MLVAALLLVARVGAQDGDVGGVRVAARSRSQRPGELVVLTITVAVPVTGVRVRAFNRDVAAFPVGERVWEALVGIDLDVRPGAFLVTVDAGSAALRTTYRLTVTPRVFPTRRLTVDEAFVTPPPSEQERITREAALLAGVWEASAGERLWTTAFVRPVPGPANSAFGSRSIFNGKPRNAHGGADFLSPAGTPIHAPGAGRVVIARELYFSGNSVVIDHGLGLFSMLAHLSSIDVREGDTVTAGQPVGLVGATGRVTGPHLHWAVRAGGARVDPLAVLALLGPQPAATAER